MKTINVLLVTATVMLLSACGSSNNSNVDTTTDFNGFVISTFAKTADNSDPIDVNALDFRFADQENPAAFDSLL